MERLFRLYKVRNYRRLPTVVSNLRRFGPNALRERILGDDFAVFVDPKTEEVSLDFWKGTEDVYNWTLPPAKKPAANPSQASQTYSLSLEMDQNSSSTAPKGGRIEDPAAEAVHSLLNSLREMEQRALFAEEQLRQMQLHGHMMADQEAPLFGTVLWWPFLHRIL
jgi:hypothetical protein